MTTTSQILADAMALSPGDRAVIARTLLQSLPEGPRLFRTEQELATELNQRLSELGALRAGSSDAYEAVERVRQQLLRKAN